MLKIYGAPVSVHTRKAIVVANMKGLPHEVVPVVPAMPQTLPADWRTLSPTGLIPVLADADFHLSDSTAICMYLDMTHPDHPVYPTAPRAKARALALETYAGERLFRNVVRVLFYEGLVAPRFQKRPTDRSLVEQTLAGPAAEVFGYLEQQADNEYLAGDSMSVADIAVVSNLLNYMYLGYELDRGKYRRLAGLFDRVVAHRAVQEALRGERAQVESLGLNSAVLTQLAA